MVEVNDTRNVVKLNTSKKRGRLKTVLVTIEGLSILVGRVNGL